MSLLRDDGLEGRTAVISGGSSGIGQALAVAYARAGANSVIGYYPGDPHDASETVKLVEREGAQCEAVELDVRAAQSVDEFAQRALDAFGRLDIGVAAAGILRRNSLMQMDEADWNDMLDVDLTGVMRVFKSSAQRMTSGGVLVATSSIAGGIYGWEDHAHYAAAKSGVIGLCRSVATELAPKGIRCNAVVPGLIESPQSLDAENSLGPEGLRQAGANIPVGRVGTVDECARAIRFLTSDDSAYVTGQQLVVDGGLITKWPS